jgi:hypothetical protein
MTKRPERTGAKKPRKAGSCEKVAPLLRQLPWTHHLIVLGRTKYPERTALEVR